MLFPKRKNVASQLSQARSLYNPVFQRLRNFRLHFRRYIVLDYIIFTFEQIFYFMIFRFPSSVAVILRSIQREVQSVECCSTKLRAPQKSLSKFVKKKPNPFHFPFKIRRRWLRCGQGEWNMFCFVDS